MTEDEAKQKWCPFVRGAILKKRFDGEVGHFDWESQKATNRKDGDGFYCIASECMAWRWWLPPHAADEERCDPTGYCGLAGEPS